MAVAIHDPGGHAPEGAGRNPWLEAYREALDEYQRASRFFAEAGPDTVAAAALLVDAALLKCRAARMMLDGPRYRPPALLPWMRDPAPVHGALRNGRMRYGSPHGGVGGSSSQARTSRSMSGPSGRSSPHGATYRRTHS
jgi:hypothetical protein